MKKIFLISVLLGYCSMVMAQSEAQIEALYKKGRADKWVEVISDPLTSYDSSDWVLDGRKSRVDVDEKGLILSAGAVIEDNAYHTVLWHREMLYGDVMVEYDYTRIDKSAQGSVNIIYLLAQGSGVGEYTKDIMEWNHLRVIPDMRTYFNNMNTYHISYAVQKTDRAKEDDYIRARRYNPTAGNGLHDTDLQPEYYDVHLFKPGVKYHITVMLRGDKMFMEVEGDGERRLFWFGVDTKTKLTEGYLGFRHMWGRSARYANLKVYQIK